MLLNELNMRSLGVSAESVLPLNVAICVEGKELSFNITAFHTGFGSGKKTVISGKISLNDANHTSTELNNSDIEAIRRKVTKLLGLKTTSERKPRAVKESTEVDKLRASLAVARRLPKEWCKIDTKALRVAFKDARYADEQARIRKVREVEVAPLLKQIEKKRLSPEARALLLASLQ